MSDNGNVTVVTSNISPILGNATPEVVDVGSLPNDGSGDPIRVAFEKINNNFSNLFALAANASPSVEFVDVTAIPEEPKNVVNIGQVVFNNYNNTSINSAPVEEIVYTPTIPTLNIPSGPYGNQEYINVGATANDGTGDPLRVAFGKINNNFSNLFFTSTNTTTSYTVGLSDQIIFETPVNQFTQGEFQIRSTNDQGPESQDIFLSAQIKNSGLGVRWTGYATTFEGNAITRYDMDVVGSNVVIYAKPIANTVMIHFIASTVTWQGSTLPGLPIGLNGYVDSVLGTEDGLILTTEN